LGGIIEISNHLGDGVEFKFTIPKLNIKTVELDILSKLSQRTVSYFTQTLNLSLQREFLFKEYTKFIPKDINVMINLNGGIDGQIIMGVSNELAIIMVNNFVKLELPEDEIAFLAAENVAETLNITLGNILKDFYLVSDSESISISTPQIAYKNDLIDMEKNVYMESSIAYRVKTIGYLCSLSKIVSYPSNILALISFGTFTSSFSPDCKDFDCSFQFCSFPKFLRICLSIEI
jgi:CheY-specific phosphatase CheX